MRQQLPLPRLLDALRATRPARAAERDFSAEPPSPSAPDARPPRAVRRVRGRPIATDVDLVTRVAGMSRARAARLLDHIGGIPGLAGADVPELRAGGATTTAAKAILDALDLARRATGAPPTPGRRLPDAESVAAHMRARLAATPVEEFWAIALNVRNIVMFETCIARGSLTGVDVHPRDVFRPLIKAGAATVLFCHNHPSGDPAPSRQDIELTTRLRDVGELCGIVVLDHVVVALNGHVSMAQRNWR
jgi:DNA repair protein RadC